MPAIILEAWNILKHKPPNGRRKHHVASNLRILKSLICQWKKFGWETKQKFE